MKLQMIAVGAVGAAAAVLGVSCYNQPTPGCSVGQGKWAVRYYAPRSGLDAGQPCFLFAEEIGIDTYAAQVQGPSVNGVPTVQPSSGPTTLFVEGAQMAVLAATDGGADIIHSPFAKGQFATQPDSNNLCSAPTMTPSEQNLLSAIDGGPQDIVYQWTNVQFVSTPSYPGTQMQAQVTYFDNVAHCQQAYTVLGIFPSKSCDDGTGQPNQDLCNPYGIQDAGIPASGINPDFPTLCDPLFLHCVLKDPADGGHPQIPDVTGYVGR